MENARAAVTLDGEVLFQGWGVMAYPAEKRAQGIGARLRAIAADRSVPPEALRVVEGEHGSDILAGDRLVLTVTEADAKPGSVPRRLMAEAMRRRIVEAITAYRNDRSPRILLRNTAYALGATLVAAALLYAARRAFRGLGTFAERRIKSRIEGLEAKSFRLIQARQLWTATRGFFRTVYVLAIVLIAYLYLQLVLELYPWSRPLARRLVAVFLAPLGTMAAAFLEALPNLIFIAILILVARYALKLLRLFFAGVDHGTITLSGFDRDWSWPTYRIARLVVVAFAVVVAYPYIPGSSSAAFQGVSIFLGVIFSLGSSSFIANLIAGYSLTYQRAFKVGDRIQVNELTGDVTEMRLQVTHLRTIKNEEIVVPNSLILNSHVINYNTLARTRGLILHTTVGIGYETSWRQVEAMLKLAAERTPGLLREPPPFVLQKSLGDFAVTYELNVYCDSPQGMNRLYTALHQNILDVFNEYGVQIMTPAYEGDPDQPKLVPQEQWFTAPAKPPERGDGSDATGERSAHRSGGSPSAAGQRQESEGSS